MGQKKLINFSIFILFFWPKFSKYGPINVKFRVTKENFGASRCGKFSIICQTSLSRGKPQNRARVILIPVLLRSV